MRSTSSGRAADGICNSQQCTLLPSLLWQAVILYFKMANTLNTQSPYELNIWFQANTSNDLHLAHVSLSIKKVGLDVVCEILELTLKSHQSEV